MSKALRVVCVVVLGALVCLAAEPVAAQTVLISNLDGNDATQSAALSDTRNKGMGFTMPAGQDYTLSHVTMRLDTSGAGTNPVVQIWTNASGLPGSVIETLTNPTFASAGIANYDFTSSGITLAAGTSYWIVAYGVPGAVAYDWKASSPAQIPTGIASHLGALFDTNGPPPTTNSSIICSYSVTAAVAGGDADLEVTKSAQTTGPTTGLYSIRVDNLGPDDATGVVVTDTLPGGVTYVSDDCGGVPGTPWTWNLGALANGAFDTCTITVDIVDPGNTANVADASATQNDPDPSNNSSTAQLPPFGGPIPTLGSLGLFLLVGLIAGSGLILLRRLL